MKAWLDKLDRKSFLGIHLWDFGAHSFCRQYAWLFLRKAMLPRPLRALRALRDYRQFVRAREDLFPRYERFLALPNEGTFAQALRDTKPLVGLGFCLKPYDPEDGKGCCPSGRANHDCLFLEKGETREACADCLIRKVGEKCLATGCKVYVMTSARDIAEDFLLPQIRSNRFPSAILLLCPYSIQAILYALLFAHMNAYLIAYGSGACRDYAEWLQADRGIKHERTAVSGEAEAKLMNLLDQCAQDAKPRSRFERKGNVFYPTETPKPM